MYSLANRQQEKAVELSLVVPVRLAACSEESSVLKRLPEPLLFRIQYRMARVALSKTLLRSLLHSMLCFF